MTVRNRITGEGMADPSDLLAHPQNYRIHPDSQQAPVEAALNTLGWVQRVIVNERTGHVIDGHLRVLLALRRNEPQIPVLYVDLDPDEEAAALASLDTITGMAQGNAYVFEQLMRDLSLSEPALLQFLDNLARELGIVPGEEGEKEFSDGKELNPEDFDLEHCCPECGFEFN